MSGPRSVRLRRGWLAISLAVLAMGSPAFGKTELELWDHHTGQSGERLRELVQRFNTGQTAYEVRPIYKAGSATPLIAAYRAKKPPHLVIAPDRDTLLLLLSGATLPVQQVMREHGVAFESGRFFEPVRACLIKEGQLHAMPLSPGTPLLYYNRDIFRRAGLDPARAPVTFDEIETVATRVMRTNAATCGFSHTQPSSLIETLHAWHNQPIADQQNGLTGFSTRLLIDGEFGATLWETLDRWHKGGFYTYGGRGRSGDALFTGGQCAVVLAGTSLVGALRETKFDWGTGRLPHLAGFPQGGTLVGGSALWVLKGHTAADYQGVARFLEFVSRTDQQAWWHRVTGYLPVSPDVVRQLEAERWFVAQPGHFTAAEQLMRDRPGGAGCLRLGNLAAIRDTVDAELEMVLTGRKTPREGLNDAVKKGNELLQDFAALYR